MRSGRHLSLGHRKSLLPVTLTDRVYAERGVDTASDDTAKTFREAVQSLARLQPDHGRDEQPLDVAVPDLLRRAASTVLGLDASFDETIEAIQSAATTCDCATCGDGEICRGTRGDDALVARRGLCMPELLAASETASAVALRYYEDHSPLFGEAERPVVRLSTVAVTGRPHSCPGLQLGIGAATAFDEEAGRFLSDVALSVRLSDVNRFSILAAPYVLLHEHLCHAFQYTHPTASGRRSLTHWDTFSEGWMDHVVMLVMEEVAGGGASTTHPIGFEQVRAGREIHLARSNATVIDRPRMAAQTCLGVRAAVEVERGLVDMLGREEGRRAFLALSFDINLSRHTVTERHAAVTTIVRALATNSGPRDEVTCALAGYARDRAAATFMADLAPLARRSV